MSYLGVLSRISELQHMSVAAPALPQAPTAVAARGVASRRSSPDTAVSFEEALRQAQQAAAPGTTSPYVPGLYGGSPVAAGPTGTVGPGHTQGGGVRVNRLGYAPPLAPGSWHPSAWYEKAGSQWSKGYHTGVDFGAAAGTPVFAIADARVVRAGRAGVLGNQVIIELPDGKYASYNHLGSIAVSQGDTVVAGQRLGGVGNTGTSYEGGPDGMHLHFEITRTVTWGTEIDPAPYIVGGLSGAGYTTIPGGGGAGLAPGNPQGWRPRRSGPAS